MGEIEITKGTKAELRIEQADGSVKVFKNYTTKTNQTLDTDLLQFDRMGLLSETHCPEREDKVSASGTIMTRCGRTLKSFHFLPHGKDCKVCGMPHDFRRVRKVVKEQK
jgi:hypothetical protein